MTSLRDNAAPAPLDRSQLEGLRRGLELLALRALGERAAAEEVAQETLARAVVAAERGTVVQEGRLAAFVAGIARHVIADRQRDDAKRAPLSAAAHLVSAEADPLSRLMTADERAAVHAALALLSPADRELLQLCYFDGLSPADIAAQLGEPAERIRKRKSRALERVREALARGVGHVRAPTATLAMPRALSPTEDAP